MRRIPKAGEGITLSDFDKIVAAVEKRRHKFPNEAIATSMGAVLFSVGEEFGLKLGWIERDFEKT